MLVTLIYEMIRRNAHRGIAALCLGGGNAVAMAVERRPLLHGESCERRCGRIQSKGVMELMHHQPMLREIDGVWVCSRCGLINPSDNQPCIPTNLEPSSGEFSGPDDLAA